MPNQNYPQIYCPSLNYHARVIKLRSQRQQLNMAASWHIYVDISADKKIKKTKAIKSFIGAEIILSYTIKNTNYYQLAYIQYYEQATALPYAYIRASMPLARLEENYSAVYYQQTGAEIIQQLLAAHANPRAIIDNDIIANSQLRPFTISYQAAALDLWHALLAENNCHAFYDTRKEKCPLLIASASSQSAPAIHLKIYDDFNSCVNKPYLFAARHQLHIHPLAVQFLIVHSANQQLAAGDAIYIESSKYQGKWRVLSAYHSFMHQRGWRCRACLTPWQQSIYSRKSIRKIKRQYHSLKATIASSESNPADHMARSQYLVKFPFEQNLQTQAQAIPLIQSDNPQASNDRSNKSAYGINMPWQDGTPVLIAFLMQNPDLPIILGGIPNSSHPTLLSKQQAETQLLQTAEQQYIKTCSQPYAKMQLGQSAGSISWLDSKPQKIRLLHNKIIQTDSEKVLYQAKNIKIKAERMQQLSKQWRQQVTIRWQAQAQYLQSYWRSYTLHNQQHQLTSNTMLTHTQHWQQSGNNCHWQVEQAFNIDGNELKLAGAALTLQCGASKIKIENDNVYLSSEKIILQAPIIKTTS